MLSRLSLFIKYNVPKFVIYIGFWFLISSCVVGAIAITPKSIRDVYFSSAIHTVDNLSKWAKYSIRALSFNTDDSTHVVKPVHRSWGNVDGMTQDGYVALRLYEDEGIIRIKAELADLVITNPRHAALEVNKHLRKQVQVDYYQYEENGEIHDCVVLWIDDIPLNHVLVNAGAAKPIETPPTNIVNQMMKSYYWGKL